MVKKIVQVVVALACSLVCLTSLASAASLPPNDIVRVGLQYGSNTLAGGNLLNEVGDGYRFGFYDGDRIFTNLGYTGQTGISVVKTQNVYYGYVESYGRNGYSDKISSDIAVGCYHVQWPGTYASFDEAQALAGTIQGGFVAYIKGAYYVRQGAYLNKDAALVGQSELGVGDTIIAATTQYGVSVVTTGTNQILFQYDMPDGYPLTIKPGVDDTVRCETIFKGTTYYGDFQYERRDGGDLTVVNFVNVEDYVKCVITYEMSSSWPLEALKAQSVSARTYAAISLNKHSQYGFDLCTSIDCQVYYGAARVTEHSDQAVDETAGQYAWYGDTLVQTYYYSSNGGASEDVKNVWGSDIPYLKGVVDIYEPLVADKTGKYDWVFTFTNTELKEILHKKGYLCSDIVNFYVAQTTEMGNVYKITFVDDNGKSWSFVNTQREYCRTLLNLNSIRYTIQGGGGTAFVNGHETTIDNVATSYVLNGKGELVPLNDMPYVLTGSGTTTQMERPDSTTDVYTIIGSGWGHNVGMSQWGAYSMATEGLNYLDILTYYFTGIEVRAQDENL